MACGCGETTAEATPTADTELKTETTPAETDNGRENVKDSLPETMDFGGVSMRVLARTGDADTKMEFVAEELTGDVINDAVFHRNNSVAERLNVAMEINGDDTVTRHSGLSGRIKNSVTADSDDFDLVANAMFDTMKLVPENCFLALNGLPHLDFDAPWYNGAFFELTDLNGKNYVAMGELAQTMTSGAFVMFFNKKILNDYYKDEINLYEEVLSGEWTLDRLIELCEPVYTDVNGNGELDEEDVYGNYYRNQKMLGADSFLGASRILLLEITEEGQVLYNGNSERMASFCEKMNSLLFVGNKTYRGEFNDDTVMIPLAEDHTLFSTWMISGIDQLRDMESPFGIIPMPKLDLNQEDYTTYAHDGSSAFALPITNSQTEATAAFLEAMSAESYRTVTPAYFETALKTKYSRDSETAQMLDIVVEGIYLDAAYIYGQNVGTPVDKVRGILSSSTECEKYASTMASAEKSMVSSMEKLIEQYKKLG